LITNDAGDIYYTVDGSDPRLPGGGIGPSAVKIDGTMNDLVLLGAGADGWSYLDDGSDQGGAWKEFAFEDDAWETGDAPLGYGVINGHPFGGPEINLDKNVTVYFRKEIEVADINLITEARAHVMSDGGAIVYLNGVEIARDNMPAGPVDLLTTALSDSNVSEGNIDIFEFSPSAFVEGVNVIAVEVHNGTVASSDMGMDLQIEVTSLNSQGDAITINSPTTVLTRSFDGSDWSALNEATLVTALPASADNLVISEIFYNPSGQLEISEYLELMNIGLEPISLAGVVFSRGVAFGFPLDSILAPGERLLLVADLAGFESAFGMGLPVAGTYLGQLDNGGEELLLSASNGDPIQSFRYDDGDPWSQNADGGGFSLTLIAPYLDPNEATSWRSSVDIGGSPGGSDALVFSGNTPDELFAYALSDPLSGISASVQAFEVNGEIDDYLVASVSAKTAADDVEITVEFSADLESWLSGTGLFLGSDEQTGGERVLHWRAPFPLSASLPSRFARAVLVARP